MNKQQRKQLSAVLESLREYADEEHLLEVYTESGLASIITAIDDAKDTLNTLADEEEEKLDNMPEAFQSGERGWSIQEAMEALRAAADRLDFIDLSEHVAPEEGWHEDVAQIIESAIDDAESF